MFEPFTMNQLKKSVASVYMAGPDVFRSDVDTFSRQAKETAESLGLKVLFPCDNLDFTTIPKDQIARAIFAGNIALMEQADFMIANTNAWRGLEPDSGTCWEMAYMYSQGKPVIAYRSNGLSMVDTINESRVARGLKPMDVDELGQHWHEGNFVENFSNPLNLMLQQSVSELVIGDVNKALESVASLHRRINGLFECGQVKRSGSSSLKMC